MITGMNHASFTVSDLDMSIKFYSEILELKLVNKTKRSKEFGEKATGIKDACLMIAYFSAGNCAVELIQYLSPEGHKINTATNNVGSAHICFNVDQFDDMVETLQKNKVKIVAVCEIPDGPNKGKRMLYFEDPDGNTLEFIEA